jgi:hypothetical protein
MTVATGPHTSRKEVDRSQETHRHLRHASEETNTNASHVLASLRRRAKAFDGIHP